MTEISAAEAAQRLGTSRQWVTTLLRQGSLAGRQLSSRAWIVDEASLRPHLLTTSGAGRSWSPLASWALLSELADKPFVAMTATLRSRVRARIRDTDAETISRRVASRTRWRSFAADDAQAVAARLTLTGASASEQISRDLAERKAGVRGYVAESHLDEFVTANWMIPGDGLMIGTFPDGVGLGGLCAPAPVIAADLALSSVTRERSVALRELERMRSSWLASRTG